MTTPCAGSPEPFDVLIDHTRGPEWQYALRAARNLCGDCPIMAACHRENAGEQWVEALYATTVRRAA